VLSLEDLAVHPNPLAAHYRHFRVAERILLTGHSHQAWPDCGLAAQELAWRDAAELVDEKWERATAVAAQVRRGYADLLDDDAELVALAPNTHDLVVRFLSALPLRKRPRLVTTDGEFHTIRRQLDRLAEEGFEVVKVPALPAGDVAARLAEATNDRTAAVLVSSVLYRSGHVVPGLGAVMEACRRHGAELLVDAYHQLNVVPFSLREEGLEDAYVTGAGYKYCQLGEGNGFLRFPRDCALRPVITGWFSEFAALYTEDEAHGGVGYGAGPDRFAGATYEPVSHYRAAAVFDFFREQELAPTLLREINQHQIGLLEHLFDALDLDPVLVDRDRTVPRERRGGFLVLTSPRAGDFHHRLRERDVWTDFRGDALRLGPAPYLSDRQLEQAIGLLGEVARSLG
jgi:kynureninase